MAFGFGDLGGIISGVAGLAGAAGDVANIFRKPASPNVSANPFTGTIQAPAYTFGGGTLMRRNDDFLTGQRRIRSLTGGLLERTQPGFGELTKTGVDAIRRKAAQAAGGLRAQMARRQLSGASFAEDQLAGVEAEYAQLESEFRAQAFQEEMVATNQLIDQEQGSLLVQAQTELAELENGLSFLQSVNQISVSQAAVDKRIKEDELLAKYGQVGLPSPTGPVGATQGPVNFAGTPIVPPVPGAPPVAPPPVVPPPKPTPTPGTATGKKTAFGRVQGRGGWG